MLESFWKFLRTCTSTKDDLQQILTLYSVDVFFVKMKNYFIDSNIMKEQTFNLYYELYCRNYDKSRGYAAPFKNTPIKDDEKWRILYSQYVIHTLEISLPMITQEKRESHPLKQRRLPLLMLFLLLFLILILMLILIFYSLLMLILKKLILLLRLLILLLLLLIIIFLLVLSLLV
jgi:hypothetical protein